MSQPANPYPLNQHYSTSINSSGTELRTIRVKEEEIEEEETKQYQNLTVAAE